MSIEQSQKVNRLMQENKILTEKLADIEERLVQLEDKYVPLKLNNTFKAGSKSGRPPKEEKEVG